MYLVIAQVHVFLLLFIALNPLDVGCVLIDNLVLDAWFISLVVSSFQLAVSNCEYSQICILLR